jgi:lipopolysaccharide cholinephosphotransferase
LKNILDENILVKLHKIQIELLDEFASICDKNNLTYFLTAGTLLGAVRHKGFIPWDDDLDVGMPRYDYEKFLDIYLSIEKSKYYLLSCRSPENTVCHYEPYAKLCKKGTVFAENHIDKKKYCGIWIDIFPYDNCVQFLVPLHTKLAKSIWRLYRIKAHIDIPKNKVKYIIGKILCLFFPLQFLNILEKKLYLLFNNIKTRYITFFSGKYGYKYETHNINEIYPLTKLFFEEKYYNVPGNWNNFLKKLYGDYMKLPPVEQRTTHEPKYILFGDVENS